MNPNQTFDAAFWDRMYRDRKAPWDPEPNDTLAEVAAGLPAGAALDMGCGEGADAIWLAARGWRVTAADVSGAALERARAADPEGCVEWRKADFEAWDPPAGAFDLVSAHFLHVPPAARPAFFARLARATRPGGTLVFVAHHPSDLATMPWRPNIPDLYFTAEEVVAALGEGWEVQEDGTRGRPAKGPDGSPITIQDLVVRVRRT